MERSETLTVIQQEPDWAKRLDLLVRHKFHQEAWEFIEQMVGTQTAFFWNTNDESTARMICRPLPLGQARLRGERGTLLICHAGPDFEGSQVGGKAKSPTEFAFELGWDRDILRTEESSRRRLARLVFAQALVRPINHWTPLMAEGTSRAAETLLGEEDPLARQLLGLYLIWQLRQADFKNMAIRLAGRLDIAASRAKDDPAYLVEWTVNKLLSLGWTPDQLRKELFEWMRLHATTNPYWMVAVAQQTLFDDYEIGRAMALRSYAGKALDNLIDRTKERTDEMRERENQIILKLADLGLFDQYDPRLAENHLAAGLCGGKSDNVRWVFDRFGVELGLYEQDKDFSATWRALLGRAIDLAISRSQPEIVVWLCTRFEVLDHPQLPWARAAKRIRSLD